MTALRISGTVSNAIPLVKIGILHRDQKRMNRRLLCALTALLVLSWGAPLTVAQDKPASEPQKNAAEKPADPDNKPSQVYHPHHDGGRSVRIDCSFASHVCFLSGMVDLCSYFSTGESIVLCLTLGWCVGT